MGSQPIDSDALRQKCARHSAGLTSITCRETPKDIAPTRASVVGGPALVVLIVVAGGTSHKPSGNCAEQDLLLVSPGGYRAHLMATQPSWGVGRENEREDLGLCIC